MTGATVIETRRNGNRVGNVGERVELARYRVPAGERVVVGQRVNGIVRVSDLPSDGIGRAYLVERELELDGYAALLALVKDYVEYAERYAEVPMVTSAFGRDLGEPAS